MKKITAVLKSKALRLIIAVVLLYLIVQKFQIEVFDIADKIVDYRFIFLALLISITINIFISAKRWQIFLKFSGIEDSMANLIKINVMSAFYGLLLPSGQAGDGFRIYMIEKRFPEKRGHSGGTVIADRMIGFIIFCFIACFGSFYLPETNALLRIRIIIFAFTGFLILLTFIIINQKIYEIVSGFLSKIRFLRRVFNYIEKLHEGLTILPYDKIVPKVGPLILVYQINNILIAHLIFMAFDVHLPFNYHLALIPVIQILTILPVSLASLGFREGLFIYFYKLINIPEDISFSVSLTYFILTALTIALIGGLVSMLVGVKLKKIGS
ncbi:lysylphosphatidylglycerol synthase transmembrane domain-containing protein [Fulvivirgaceae bacterium BMA10]|uniref:Lysylphosphatidylglycerol synthase transmembrane domain-containing protein n=1 Tax=Splendidivirga corallicola TaxID=3051826 RepID=A0ABT8KSC1_9BACT|nr:lysylphosphatidylglycerol synthase transmembrane domain-containing protein [Fulvivirgaceae bacterium BMA10]